MADQQELAFAWGDSMVGYELDCLIDEEVEEGLYAGRTYADAPEIDGAVYVQGENLNVGDFIPVEIVERRDYDWIATTVEE
jgi:ribosomal protein S12 methylthiotransferase